MFERPQHRSVLRVLAALRADRLRDHGFWFGGGTRIVLELDEYRESRDIDFLCSDPSGYSGLRRIAATEGYAGLFSLENEPGLRFPREIRLDQYGIRFPVFVDGEPLKVELIREARILLDPGITTSWSPVDCMTLVDCYAEKLLANSDRWADRQFLARDLLDLAALRRKRGAIPEAAWHKSKSAYRDTIQTDLVKALAAFDRDEAFRRRCWEGLAIHSPASLEAGLRLLHDDLSRPHPNPHS